MTDSVTRTGEIALPFRILPSRGRNFFPSICFTLIGAIFMVAGIVYGEAWVEKIGFGLGGGVFAAIGVYFLRHERRYFDPKNSYWMVVSSASLTIVTPDGDEEFAWRDLASFVVTREVTRDKDSKTRSTRKSISYTLTAQVLGDDDRKLKIELDDFATQFQGDEEHRAEAMCAALNELRQLCLKDDASTTGVHYPVPSGLVVAPMAVAVTPEKPVSKLVERP